MNVIYKSFNFFYQGLLRVENKTLNVYINKNPQDWIATKIVAFHLAWRSSLKTNSLKDYKNVEKEVSVFTRVLQIEQREATKILKKD